MDLPSAHRLSEIAKIEPHAAYTAFTHGLKHRYTYGEQFQISMII